MVDHLDDVVDDISVFHRVPYGEVLELPSSRFFRMAARLPIRGGAVAHSLATAERQPQPIEAPPSIPAPAPPVDVDNSAEIAAVAAMSQNPGFPTIGYAS